MIRDYKEADRQKVIRIFRLNTPEFFDLNEESDFESYLKKHAGSYLVFEKNGYVVGGGGYYFDKKNKEGHISWNLVDPKFQGEGIGTKLVEYCLDAITSHSGIETIIVSTSQKAFQFYEKFGFKTRKIKKDFWGKDLDLYEMELIVN